MPRQDALRAVSSALRARWYSPPTSGRDLIGPNLGGSIGCPRGAPFPSARCVRGRRCCTAGNRAGILPTAGSQIGIATGSRPPHLEHPIQDVASDRRLRRLRIRVTRTKPAAYDRLQTEEGVLNTPLAMVAGLLLPPPPPDLADSSDRPIAFRQLRLPLGRWRSTEPGTSSLTPGRSVPGTKL